jgi:uncharacterized protein (DUF305 family)
MKRYAVAALLAAATLTLASCGASAGGGQENMEGMDDENMEGMDHSEMDHGSEETGGMASMSEEMVKPNGEYSDEAFIDSMIPHHEGAVEMAEVALENSEHEEIRTLSEEIISAQEAEIEQLKSIREEEFGSAEPELEMSEADMEAMGMSDPEELAQADPFDRAFIDEMVVHHESAIVMANVALSEGENEEIKSLAQDIVAAQRQEIEQMRQWRQEWYPEG